jgi:hypothetical protein
MPHSPGRTSVAEAPSDVLAADPAAHAYPRPQLVRDGWTSLNGRWQFVIDPDGRWRRPEDVPVGRRGDRRPVRARDASQRRDRHRLLPGVLVPPRLRRAQARPGERLILHFGAVDYAATVWVNRMRVGSHEGGYLPFSLDVTEAPVRQRPDDGLLQELVVCATDDPHDVAKPRGKQDWQREPHSIWYPRTSGIWQTVWLEVVSATYIGSLRWSASLERWEIGVDLTIAGERRPGLRARVKLSVGGTVIADDTYQVIAGEVHRRIALSDPGSTTTATSCSGARGSPRSSTRRSSCGPGAASGSTR